MSGYCDFSKSNNAVDAEAAGRYPASIAARKLGLPAGFVRDCCGWATHGEWHHTSKYYNSVAYYDADEIKAWMSGEPESFVEHGDFRDSLAAWKEGQAVAAAKPATIHAGVKVLWLEWGGTRASPRAFERAETGATVTDAGGRFVTVKLADGTEFRKGRDTRGFEVYHPTSGRIYL